MATTTERQEIINHCVENKRTFQKPVDLAIYLKRDQQKTRPVLSGQKEYVDKVLKSGYKSGLMKQLFEDVNEAVGKPAKEKPVK